MKRAKGNALCLVVALVSFLGFWVENLFRLMTKGCIDNRNMCLPFLLGYGLAIAAIYFLFGTPQALRLFHRRVRVKNRCLQTVLYFLLVCLCVAAGEILLGTLVEATCHIVWWDYTGIPLHLTKYTSLPTTLAFGALITLFMGLFFTPLYTWAAQVQGTWFRILMAVLIGLLTADFLHSALWMYTQKKLFPLWKLVLFPK